MLSYIELAFAWLLFLSLPILATGMFYRARKYRAVRGKLLPEEAGIRQTDASPRLQHYCFVLNIAAGLTLFAIVAAVLLFGLAFVTWSGSAALVVWSYAIATLMLERMRRKEGAAVGPA